MALPPIIEYLLSLERPGGRGNLVYSGVSQLLIPAFPPLTTISLATTPLTGDFGYISYANAIGPAVVPGAFWFMSQYHGSRQYSGTLGSWYVNNTVDSFMVVTRNDPLITQITNQTALNQFYEGISFFIGIISIDDYKEIMDLLDHLATSSESERLSRDAVRLLKILARER